MASHCEVTVSITGLPQVTSHVDFTNNRWNLEERMQKHALKKHPYVLQRCDMVFEHQIAFEWGVHTNCWACSKFDHFLELRVFRYSC